MRRIFFMVSLALIVDFILPFSSLGQDALTRVWKDPSKPDSIRLKAINEYYKSQTYAKPEEVLNLTFLHEELAKKTNNQQEISQAFNERSYAYFVMGDLKNSRQNIKQSITILEKLNDEVKLVSLYVNLANILSVEGLYKDAVDYYHKSLDMFRKSGNWQNEATTLNNIGIQLINLEGYDLALHHFEEALTIYQSKNKMDAAGPVLAGSSLVYYNQDKLDLAISTCEKSIVLLEKDNNQSTKSDAYFVLSKSYLKKGDKTKARLYLDESLKISRALKNNSAIFDRLIFDAKLLVDDDLNIATQKAENLRNELNSDISYAIKAELYELLYNCYKGQGKYDKSLEMYEKHKLFSDSAATQKVKIEIMRQVLQKEYDDDLHKKEAESKTRQIDLKNSHRNKLIGLVLLGFVVIGILIYYGKSKISLEQQKGEELLRELESVKKQAGKVVGMDKQGDLNKEKLETVLDKKINETDWNVLNILLSDPVISNKDLADKAYMSVDGIGSSLRRMYEYFDIANSKYMKIALLLKAIKLSNQENGLVTDKD